MCLKRPSSQKAPSCVLAYFSEYFVYDMSISFQMLTLIFFAIVMQSIVFVLSSQVHEICANCDKTDVHCLSRSLDMQNHYGFL